MPANRSLAQRFRGPDPPVFAGRVRVLKILGRRHGPGGYGYTVTFEVTPKHGDPVVRRGWFTEGSLFDLARFRRVALRNHGVLVRHPSERGDPAAWVDELQAGFEAADGVPADYGDAQDAEEIL